MKALFIAGTDTGVGKTVITGLLARYLTINGYRTVTQKWVQTGAKNFPQDISVHLRLMQKKRKEFNRYLPSMMPYIFKQAASPHLAGCLEGKTVRIKTIKEGVKALTKNFDFIVIEGTGGLLVPLNKKMLLIDVVKRLNLNALLVAGNRLGAINHALLSVEALMSRGIPIIGIIFNTTSKNIKDKLILKDNPLAVERLTGIPVLGTLPYRNRIDSLFRPFAPIGDRICERLTIG